MVPFLSLYVLDFFITNDNVEIIPVVVLTSKLVLWFRETFTKYIYRG